MTSQFTINKREMLVHRDLACVSLSCRRTKELSGALNTITLLSRRVRLLATVGVSMALRTIWLSVCRALLLFSVFLLRLDMTLSSS